MNLLRLQRGRPATCGPRPFKQSAWSCPVADQLRNNATAIASLTRQLMLKRGDAGGFQRVYARLLDEVIRLDKNIPTVPAVSRHRTAPEVSPPTLEDITSLERTIDPSEILIRRGRWTRFDYGDRLAVAPQYTHSIMPGTYHVLASDGIRAIITPADAPDRARTVVHTTNLKRVKLDIDISHLTSPKKPRTPKAPPTYNIDDLL